MRYHEIVRNETASYELPSGDLLHFKFEPLANDESRFLGTVNGKPAVMGELLVDPKRKTCAIQRFMAARNMQEQPLADALHAVLKMKGLTVQPGQDTPAPLAARAKLRGRALGISDL